MWGGGEQIFENKTVKSQNQLNQWETNNER